MKLSASPSVTEGSIMKDGDPVMPGDYLCTGSKFKAGPGTVLRCGKLYSTLSGRVKLAPPSVSVQSSSGELSVPTVGSVVVGKVDSVSERQAKLTLLSVNGRRLQYELHGIVRREDVRAVERDSVEVFQSLRPGDVVRARVISLGESQAYVLSTGEVELGVVLGRGERGERLVPLSWCEMQGVRSGIRERRKVAKVISTVPI